jgi:hypothetical protein
MSVSQASQQEKERVSELTPIPHVGGNKEESKMHEEECEIQHMLEMKTTTNVPFCSRKGKVEVRTLIFSLCEGVLGEMTECGNKGCELV